jgi:hypothetical protein
MGLLAPFLVSLLLEFSEPKSVFTLISFPCLLLALISVHLVCEDVGFRIVQRPSSTETELSLPLFKDLWVIWFPITLFSLTQSIIFGLFLTYAEIMLVQRMSQQTLTSNSFHEKVPIYEF